MKKILLCLVIGINIFFAQTQKIAITGVWPVPSVDLYFSHNNQIIFMPQSAKNALINSLAVEFYPKIRQIKASNDQNLEELLGHHFVKLQIKQEQAMPKTDNASSPVKQVSIDLKSTHLNSLNDREYRALFLNLATELLQNNKDDINA